MQDNENLIKPLTSNPKMKKTLLVGRHGAGKTTLKQALKDEKIQYVKTQYMDYGEWLLDSPGEYAEVHGLGAALAIYAYEADIVALLISADDDYSLFPPNITCMVNREVIGIVTKIDKCSPDRAKAWLQLSGCEKIFFVNSHNGEGVEQLKNYLKK